MRHVCQHRRAKPDVIYMLAGYAAGNTMDCFEAWTKAIFEPARRTFVPPSCFAAFVGFDSK